MLDSSEYLNIFKNSSALLEGHFILSSGLHSDRYLQSALVLQNTDVAEKLGHALAANFPGVIDTVISPAIGGLIIGHEVARAKKARAIFSEKDSNGKPIIKRGFKLAPGEKVLLIEDVVTTGLSTNEVMGLIHKSGAELVGLGSIVNRSGQNLKDIFPKARVVHSLITVDVKTWPAEKCELCKKDIPAVKPGSRKI